MLTSRISQFIPQFLFMCGLYQAEAHVLIYLISTDVEQRLAAQGTSKEGARPLRVWMGWVLIP